jgi:hypothetical protein
MEFDFSSSDINVRIYSTQEGSLKYEGQGFGFYFAFFSARAEKPEIREFWPKFQKFRVNLHVQT